MWCREKYRHCLTSVLVCFRERYELIERLGADPQAFGEELPRLAPPALVIEGLEGLQHRVGRRADIGDALF